MNQPINQHPDDLTGLLPDRPADAHKGRFGTVMIVGGHSTMLGAPALAAGGAVRGGAGLTRLACPANILPFCLTIEPAATGLALPVDYDYDALENMLPALLDGISDRTVLAVGPGMGIGPGQQLLVQSLLRHGAPVVLDADGLNNFAAISDCLHLARCPLLLTPHPGEFRRLAAYLAIREDPTDPAQRPAAAENLARSYRAVVVLKGYHTVVSDGHNTVINTTGNPALATGGSGDVLTGLIAALLAQGLSAFDAARLGAHLHGLAADLWARQFGPAGLHPRDLPAYIPQAFASLRPHPQRPA